MLVGGPQRVAEGLERFLDTTLADELMITTPVHDLHAKMRSFTLVKALQATQAEASEAEASELDATEPAAGA